MTAKKTPAPAAAEDLPAPVSQPLPQQGGAYILGADGALIPENPPGDVLGDDAKEA